MIATTPAATVAPQTRFAQPLCPIAGFEATDYALLNGQVVWVGEQPGVDHPRNLWNPWQASPFCGDTLRMQRGARTCLALLKTPSTAGLLPWLNPGPTPAPMPLWLKLATPRLDAVRQALQVNDLPAFERAALGVLGLGPGLTPSGDDFIGAICFTLQQAPRRRWAASLPAVQTGLRAAALGATNVISAALLSDMLNGHSFRALHELLAALDSEDPASIATAAQALQHIGASSGADMLCGVLLALNTWQETF